MTSWLQTFGGLCMPLPWPGSSDVHVSVHSLVSKSWKKTYIHAYYRSCELLARIHGFPCGNIHALVLACPMLLPFKLGPRCSVSAQSTPKVLHALDSASNEVIIHLSYSIRMACRYCGSVLLPGEWFNRHILPAPQRFAAQQRVLYRFYSRCRCGQGAVYIITQPHVCRSCWAVGKRERKFTSIPATWG